MMHMKHFKSPVRARARAGFTLVEVMVTIGIIVMLVGLTVAVTTLVSRRSEIRQAEDTLTLLEMALETWTTANDRQLVFTKLSGPVRIRCDIDEDNFPADDEDQQDLLLSEVLRIIRSNPQANEILSRINPQFLVQETYSTGGSGNLTRLVVRDPWDRNIRVVFPGRKWDGRFDPPNIRDVDGTIRTDAELKYGICVNGRIGFISAGPDGRFGDYSDVNDEARIADGRDDIMSYPLDRATLLEG